MVVFLTALSIWIPWACREKYLAENPFLANYMVPFAMAFIDLTTFSVYKRYLVYEDRLEITYAFGLKPPYLWTDIFTPFRFIPGIIPFAEIVGAEKIMVPRGRRRSCYGTMLKLRNGRCYQLIFEGSMPCQMFTRLVQSKIFGS